ncbi:MAG: Flp pilus assembly protein CpaB [Bacillota bacterium]|nr:Flp pilus assembly protein CpaB [Bacillota bacterium]
MKTSTRLLIIALILGAITVVALNYFINNLNTESPAGAAVGFTSVLVAQNTIPQHTRITSEMVAMQSVPVDSVHPEVFKSAEEVIGSISRSDIIKGEQVLLSRVSSENRRASLSYRVPENMRAISISVNEVSGVSGFISAGDKVDVLASFEDEDTNEVITVTTYTVVQNVEVLATGESTIEKDNEETQLVSTVTLSVTPGQAEVLAYSFLQGSFHLTLRSPLDEEIVNLDYYNAENFETFRER